MKLLLLIAYMLVLCSGAAIVGGTASIAYSNYWKSIRAEIRGATIQLPPQGIITDKEAKVVMEYHGILSMKWSIPHKDFVFERNGEICRARAFEILKGKNIKYQPIFEDVYSTF